MTTRKKLIEKIKSMRLGTKEMLIAAKYDATLIPFDTLFLSSIDGNVVWRITTNYDDIDCVHMSGFVVSSIFFNANDLLPITEE